MKFKTASSKISAYSLTQITCLTPAFWNMVPTNLDLHAATKTRSKLTLNFISHSPISLLLTSCPSPPACSSRRKSSLSVRIPWQEICRAFGFRLNISVKFFLVATAYRNEREALDSVAAALIALASASKFNGSINWGLPFLGLNKGELNKNPTSSTLDFCLCSGLL